VKRILIPLAGGLVFLGLWLALQTRQPVPAGADVYDNLSVSRHLVQGDGWLCDVVYPVSLAFPWSRCVPQPLVTRPPLPALLLIPGYALAGRDPGRTLTAVWWTQTLLLVLAAAAGWRALARRGHGEVGPAWLLLLAATPLLGIAAAWGWSELVAGVLLLLVWLRWRDRPLAATLRTRTALVDGALAGLVTLTRVELTWIPALWWCLVIAGPGAKAARHRWRLWRPLAWTAVGWLAVTGPWWLRNLVLTGSPGFMAQSYAVELDMAAEPWAYPTLRGLEPVPLAANLAAHWQAALVKLRFGGHFFIVYAGQWLPWVIWWGALALVFWHLVRHGRRGHGWAAACGLPVTLVLTLAGATLVYALLSHEVRHLLSLLPVLSWEVLVQAAQVLRRPRSRAARAAILLAVVGVSLVATPLSVGGERRSLRLAREEAAPLTALVAEARTLPPGPVFTDNAAVLWYADRAGVWGPRDVAVEARIRATVPEMRDAPWLRLYPGEDPLRIQPPPMRRPSPATGTATPQ